jgi:hypothetical protein
VRGHDQAQAQRGGVPVARMTMDVEATRVRCRIQQMEARLAQQEQHSRCLRGDAPGQGGEQGAQGSAGGAPSADRWPRHLRGRGRRQVCRRRPLHSLFAGGRRRVRRDAALAACTSIAQVLRTFSCQILKDMRPACSLRRQTESNYNRYISWHH